METYKRIKSIAEDGYSLVELVAAVGLLMLLTSVVGVASYNTINSKQTREAVRLSTQSAYNKALAAVTDYDDETTVAKALAEPAKEAAQQGITFEYLPVDEDPTKESLCVIGRINGDVDDEYTYKIGPENCVSTASKGLPPAEDQTLPDYTKAEEITRISYICDGTGTRNARLNIANIEEGTRATLFGDDQSIIPVEFSAASAKNSEIKYRDSKKSPTIENVSDTFEIKKGVEYELVVDGRFDNIGTLQHGSSGTSLDMTDCMTKISELGKDNGVKEISSFEAKKFAEIDTVQLPSTVTSIRYMFDSAPIDDPDVSSLSTGNITDMRGTFYGAKNFNKPLSNWETAKVTDMSYMFKDASKFNQHLNTSGNRWNTIKVDNMGYMFSGASSFNGTMNSWNVSTVRNMKAMFEEADNFNQDISAWSTVNVKNMARMFYGADKYNKPLTNKWNTAKVETMESMFEDAKSFNQILANWDTSSVTTMRSMFKNATSFNRPVNSWAIDQVLDMSYMFNNATSFNQSISDWRTRQTLNFVGMFQDATSFNNGYGKGVGGNSRPDNYIFMFWNLDNPDGSTRRIDVSYMFMGASSFNSNFGNLSNNAKFQWNRVTTARSMFENATSFNASIGDLKSTGNINNMMSMFRYAKSFNQELTDLTTTNATTLASMFEYAENFNNGAPIGVNTKPLNWDTAKVTVMSYTFAWTSFNQDMNGTMDNVTTTLGMFYGALEFNSVIKGMYTAHNNTSMDSMFQNTPKFNAPGASTWSTKNVTNMEDVFRSSHSFNRDIQAWDVRKVTNMKGMFWGAEAFNQLVWEWDTTNVTDMSYMFAYTWAYDQPLTNNEAAGKKWDTSNVTNMEYMFWKAERFQNRQGTTWDFSFNTAKVTNMKGMFQQSSVFNLNLNHLDTRNVTDMSYMFSESVFNNGVATNIGGATIGWNTSKVTDMSYMFHKAKYNQNFTGSMANVTTTHGMFEDNTWVRADFSGLRTTNKITDMAWMFKGASEYNISQSSNFYTDNVTRFEHMWDGATAFSQNLSGWNVPKATNYSNFARGSNLTAAKLPKGFAAKNAGL